MVGETSAGKLVVEIIGDASGLIKAYDEAKKRTEGLEGDLKTIGSRLTSIGSDLTLKVTAPLALVGAGMVTLAGDAAETQSKFEQVFGAMSEDVEEWADTYGNAVGRATTDLQDMLATTGSIVKAMGLTDEAGAEFSETITQLSVDMASFHNSADIEAFNALRSAVTGEYEPMKRFGVVINEAKVEQELLTMGISGGTKAATDAEKAQARLNIIMRVTTDAQGDAARTADSFSNQMKALAADSKELGESFGQELLPLAQDLISTMRGGIAWFSGLDEGTKKLIVTTALFAAAVGPATWAVGTLAGSVGSMIALHRTYQASTIAATIATKGFTAAIMANPLGLAIIGVTTLGAVLLPLIASTNDAADATNEYGDALREVKNLSEMTTESIEEQIEKLKEDERVIRARIDLLRSQYTPATDRQTLALRQSTQQTGWHKLATGDLTEEFRGATGAMEDGTLALGDMTQAQKDAVVASDEQKLAENLKTQAILETETATRRLADGAKTAYDQASKAVSTHQKKVTGLQKEYDELKETIDRALGIDDEIEDAGRDVERADIGQIRAKQDLADINEELAEKEREYLQGDYQSIKEREDAERELNNLRLRQWEAVLDLADAEDRYQDALAEASAKQTEKVETEKALNGESVESAQGRLDDIKKQIDDETTKLQSALTAREEAQVAHENFMSQLNNDALTDKSQKHAEYVQFMDANPAYARTYHVEYDKDGNMIGEPPELPARNIQVPTYSTSPFSVASGSGAAVAGAGGTGTAAAAEVGPAVPDEVSGDLATSLHRPPGWGSPGVVIQGDLVVNSPAADASTMMNTTKRTLRNIGTQVAL